MTFLAIITLSIFVIILYNEQSKLKREVREQRDVIKALYSKVKYLMDSNASRAEDAVSAPTCDYSETLKAANVQPPVASQTAETDLSLPKEETIASYIASDQNVATSPSKAIIPNVLMNPASNSKHPPKEPFFKNENWVGINLLNRIGALLIIIGAIATAAFDGFPEWVRSLILFAFAFSVIGVGAFMSRKKSTVFSMGVMATGVALNYVAIAASSFALGTLNMYSALFACIAATALGIFIATRYKAQVIGCFALIGGYLPIFALDPFNDTIVIGLITYFIFLSLFSLILALSQKWSVMNMIGLALTVIGTSYLGWLANPTAALMYACFAFLLYTALPLIATYRSKENFSELDVWLIIANTFISGVVIFLITYRLDIQHLHAYLSLAFAIIYIWLAFLVKRVWAHHNMQMIFTLTSIAFFVLFVPFYFEQRWFAVAWLVQAATISGYGILGHKKIAEYSGLATLGLSAFTTLLNHSGTSSEFTFNYTFFTVGALAIWGCYFIKERPLSTYKIFYKIFVFANLWIFTMYVMLNYITGYDTVMTLCVIATFALAFIYAKVKPLTDNATRILANVMHAVGIVGLWEANFTHAGLFYTNTGGLSFNLLASIIGFSMVLHYYLVENKTIWSTSYKNINLVNLWLCCLWVFGGLMRHFFGVHMVLILMTFAASFAISRIPAIHDRGTRVIAIIMQIIGFLWLWIFNSFSYADVLPFMALNAVAQIVALFILNDLINLFSSKSAGSPLKIPIMSGYFLLAVTQGMMVQANIAFSSALISIMYAVAAFAWIIVGFWLKNKPVRTAGLFLSMASVAKLLIIDTWGLSTEMRIVSYISLGLILMLISFVYQRLSKKIDG